jgi:uncharacterized protein (UPF0212 family)
MGCARTKVKNEQTSKTGISTTTKKIAKPLLNFVANDVGNTKKQQQRQKELFSMS